MPGDALEVEGPSRPALLDRAEHERLAHPGEPAQGEDVGRRRPRLEGLAHVAAVCAVAIDQPDRLQSERAQERDDAAGAQSAPGTGEHDRVLRQLVERDGVEIRLHARDPAGRHGPHALLQIDRGHVPPGGGGDPPHDLLDALDDLGARLVEGGVRTELLVEQPHEGPRLVLEERDVQGALHVVVLELHRSPQVHDEPRPRAAHGVERREGHGGQARSCVIRSGHRARDSIGEECPWGSPDS